MVAGMFRTRAASTPSSRSCSASCPNDQSGRVHSIPATPWKIQRGYIGRGVSFQIGILPASTTPAVVSVVVAKVDVASSSYHHGSPAIRFIVNVAWPRRSGSTFGDIVACEASRTVKYLREFSVSYQILVSLSG